MNKLEIQKRIKDRILQAKENQSKEESNGYSDYSYWEGYSHALDYVDDLLILLED